MTFYQLTAAGREGGYIGVVWTSTIDDALRGAFTVLREEDVPVSAGYISELIGFSRADVMSALRKLTRVGLVTELE